MTDRLPAVLLLSPYSHNAAAPNQYPNAPVGSPSPGQVQPYSVPQQHQEIQHGQQPTGSPMSPMQDSKQEYYGVYQEGQSQVQNQGTFQPAAQQSVNQTTKPLFGLEKETALVNCPICKQTAWTKVERHPGMTTQ